MKSIRVKKPELISKIMENRTNHREEYEAAMAGYRKSLKAALNQMIILIDGADIDDLSIHSMLASHSRPISHEEEYTVAIEMLKMSEEDVVEITVEEFRQYVRDDWRWKPDFKMVTERYKVS